MNAFFSDKVCLFQRLKTGPDSCHGEVGKSGNICGTESFRILPDQPVKDGEIFLGWYCTEYPRTDARWTAPPEGFSELLKAGTVVKVSSDCFFTAVWKTAE